MKRWRNAYRFTKCCLWGALVFVFIAPVSVFDNRTVGALFMSALCTLALEQACSLVKELTHGN